MYNWQVAMNDFLDKTEYFHLFHMNNNVNFWDLLLNQIQQKYRLKLGRNIDKFEYVVLINLSY